MRTIRWEDGAVILINQRKLPEKLEYIQCRNIQRVVKAIKNLEIRGAPAIGVAAAMALALRAYHSEAETSEELSRELCEASEVLKRTRPTAWNLFWAVDRILDFARSFEGHVKELKEAIVTLAQNIAEEDIAANRQIGVYGSSLIKENDVIGTICNAGWLATAGEYGTALGVVKVAYEQGKKVSVIAMETRPVLQGARLTAWELRQDNIPVRVIADGALGFCLSKGMIDKMVVGADRVVVKDGCFVFNKIGTYMAAMACRRHNVPFYVAAPISTFDFNNRLKDIVVEERDQREVTYILNRRITPDGVAAFNPAFDITPPQLVDAFITERGLVYPPFRESVLKLCQRTVMP
ncbi:MAG: S-methyl-5-thioribose-1-phosphate isomerase [Candidatus Bathyarchaeia archaeon]